MTCGCRDPTANSPCAEDPTPGVHTVRSDSGFTVRELRDVAERLRSAHRLCPHAQAHWRDEQGFVESGMTFETLLILGDDDPRMIKERAKRAELLAARRRRNP